MTTPSPLMAAHLGAAAAGGERWFSTDGRWAVIEADGKFQIWDVRTARLVHSGRAERLALSGPVLSAAVSPDGCCLLTGRRDGVVRIWRAPTGMLVGEELRHRDMVIHVEFSPDGRLAATASLDKTVCVWDATTGRRVAEMKTRAPGELGHLQPGRTPARHCERGTLSHP